MLDIIICEDNFHQRKLIETIVKQELNNLKYDLRIKLSTDNPKSVIEYIKQNKESCFIYFLDVNLENEINGIALAKAIRSYDSIGYIIFITAHTELTLLTFQYKVQALDYIIKTDTKNLKNKIIESLTAAYNDYQNLNINIDINKNNIIPIDFGNRIINFDLNEILFFETTNINHKLRIHTEEGQFEFYGTIKDIEAIVSSRYYRSHRSYLVNIDKIKSINKSKLTICMVNNETCYVSMKCIKGLIKNV
jgi:two-component system response regulator AgrA